MSSKTTSQVWKTRQHSESLDTKVLGGVVAFRKNEFVFALLDWGNTPQGRIRRHYIALGGDPAVRLTQTRLDQFDREGGMFANLRGGASAEEQADDME
jgi:hypothetical protein